MVKPPFHAVQQIMGSMLWVVAHSKVEFDLTGNSIQSLIGYTANRYGHFMKRQDVEKSN